LFLLDTPGIIKVRRPGRKRGAADEDEDIIEARVVPE
jgi:hypothetical protein